MSCLNNSGYTTAENIRAEAVKYASNWRLAQAVIMAVDNATQLIANYKKQNDIASDAMSIMEQNRAHMKNTFWTRELQYLAEYCTPEELEQVETMGRRYAGRLVSTVSDAFAKQLAALRCNASKYCTSAMNKAFQDLSMARAQAIANARILGRMIAFNEYQQRDDLNFDRRLKAAALGDGLIGEAANFMAKGQTGYANIGTQLASRMSDSITGIGMAWNSRYADPGRSQEQNDMLANLYGNVQYTPAGFMNQTPDTGLDMNFQIDSSRIGGFQRSAPETTTSWFGQQSQTQMNNARVGNWDLARVGEKTYVDYDYHGKPIKITVKMSDFKLDYMDDKTRGDS